MNNYLIRIHSKMLYRNALCYWHHNKLTDTEKYADVVQFFDKNLAVDSKILEHMIPLSAFPHHYLT
jgi:hypothetical protein